MRIGVDYYPEHWDRTLWEADADLMQKTGVQLVRLAEFAWCRLEPREGEFDFTWLDDAVAVFASRGIDVVLCTPTSCPPLWLYEKYPDAIQTGKDGHKIATGIRGHRCISNPDFLHLAERMIVAMAAHYADTPAVIAWQIDNELEANFCFCERCTHQFRSWLKQKYGSLEAINAAYGNVVWSGEYSSWDQIQPPFGSYPNAWLNPAFTLDFNRYASESIIAYSNWQAKLLRQHCPGRQITTNTWFCQNMPDFYQLFDNLDFVSYDNYPTTRIPDDPDALYSHAFHLDLMRGVKRQPFWIMEQLSGAMGCWMPMARMPEPGMIKGYALQAFAHGADTVVFFRWRTANIGAEMHWHGLIDHSNVPGRRFAEFAELCRIAPQLRPLTGSNIKADVAILLSFENEYAFKNQPQTESYYYLEQLQRLHAAFLRHGLNVDVISQTEDLSGYRIVCAPEMYVHNADAVQHLHDFAACGGTVILTTRSGVKDEHNNCIMSPLPTVYRDMAGVCVTEYAPLGHDAVDVRFADGTVCQGKQWCDVLQPEGAQVLASYQSEHFAGTPAITCNDWHQGRVYYIATVGQQPFYDHLIRLVLTSAGMAYVVNLPANVELTTRRTEAGDAVFLFNNSSQTQSFPFQGDVVTLAPYEMLIRRPQR